MAIWERDDSVHDLSVHEELMLLLWRNVTLPPNMHVDMSQEFNEPKWIWQTRNITETPTLVLAAIQLEVSLSSSHFFIHFLSHLHFTGSCQFSPHEKLKQKNVPKYKTVRLNISQSVISFLTPLFQVGKHEKIRSEKGTLVLDFFSFFDWTGLFHSINWVEWTIITSDLLRN